MLPRLLPQQRSHHLPCPHWRHQVWVNLGSNGVSGMPDLSWTVLADHLAVFTLALLEKALLLLNNVLVAVAR